MINSSSKSSLIKLLFTIELGIISIIYIQSIHGFSMSFGVGGSPQYGDRTSTLIVITNVTFPSVNETEPKTIEVRSFLWQMILSYM